MGGEGVVVSHKKETIVLILHLHEVTKGTEIVAQVQVAGGADATAHNLTLVSISHRHSVINE